MNRFCASLLVTISLNGACHHDTGSSSFLPMTKAAPGAVEEFSKSRPAVRLSERAGVIWIDGSTNSRHVVPATDADHFKHVAAVRLSEH